MTLTVVLIRAVLLTGVVMTAVLIGLAVTAGCALLGHEVLVRLHGPDLSPIDDMPPMHLAVWSAYAAGLVAGLLVLVAGWRRVVRRARATGRG